MPGIAPSPLTRTFCITCCVLVVLLASASRLTFAQGLPDGSNPVWLGKMGSQVYFTINPIKGVAALFKTDGTPSGTTRVASMYDDGAIPVFLSTGTKAYFQASATNTGQELWVTDGTATGTHLVADPYPNLVLLGLIGTDLIFAAWQADFTTQLFRTDGTAAGTHVISKFAQSQYSMVTDRLAINGKVYVALASNLSCCEPDLWATDGTSTGTVQIDSDEGYPWHLQPSSLRAFGYSVMMLTDTENRGTELSEVDTTTNALTILETVPGVGSGAAYGTSIAAMDGFVLYLRAENPTNGLQLWRSDGTLAGTILVQDMGPGTDFSQNIAVTRVGNWAVFLSGNAQSPQEGPELWTSDGTPQGTAPLIALPPAPSGGVNPVVGVVGTHGYYVAYTGSDLRLVVTDGTAAGTHVLTDTGPLDPNNVGNTAVAGDDNLAFIETSYADPASGTASHLFAYMPQTNVVVHLRDTTITGADAPPVADGGRLFFRWSDPAHGNQPWVSDGTVAGTQMLADLTQAATATQPPTPTPPSSANSSHGGGGAVDLLDLLAFIGLVIWRRYPGLTTAVARPGDRVRRFEQVLRRMWGFQELPSQDAVRLTTLWMRTSERIASGSSVPVLARDDFQTLWSAAS